MTQLSHLGNSSIWLYREPWTPSSISFLLLGVMVDIIVILLISRIIMLILKSNVGEDYIKMHPHRPKFSAINRTLESGEDFIRKQDESLLMASRILPNEKIAQSEKLHPAIKRISLELSKPDELQRKVTGLPPRDKLRHSEMLRQIPKTSFLEGIDKIEALSLATCKALSKGTAMKAEDLILTEPRHRQKSKTQITSDPRPTQTISNKEKANKPDEPCSTGQRIHEIVKLEELQQTPKGKVVKEGVPTVVSTPKTPQCKTNQVTTSRPCDERIIKKKDEALLSARKEKKKMAKDIAGNQRPPQRKEKNMKLIEVESLSSEDYSALGVRDGFIPVPKNEYQRKLIAIAMRCKIKEIQEKQLKEIQEKKLQQKALLPKAKPEPEIPIDLRTLSSDRKDSAGIGRMESASFEEIRRESLTENETLEPPDEAVDKKEVEIEIEMAEKIEEPRSVSSGTKTDAKASRDSKDASRSVLTAKDKELLEMYGNLSEEELLLEASSIVLPERGTLDDEDLKERLEPIRRRWKLPRMDGLPSTEETQTFSTGDPMPRSPWDPSYRVMAIFDPLMGDKPSETLSSGTSKPRKSKIIMKIGKRDNEEEVPSVPTTEDQEPEKVEDESTNDEETTTKKSVSRLPKRRKKRGTKVENVDSEIDPVSSAPLSTADESMPSGTSAEPEIVDLRTASPLYRLNVSKNRRRLRGIQSKVRQLEERAKEITTEDQDSETPKPDTQVSSVSISSGDSRGSEATAVTLLQPEMISSLVNGTDNSKGEAVDGGDSVTGAATDQEVVPSVTQLSHISDSSSTKRVSQEQCDVESQKPQQLLMGPIPEKNIKQQSKEIKDRSESSRKEEEKEKETERRTLYESESPSDFAERIDVASKESHLILSNDARSPPEKKVNDVEIKVEVNPIDDNKGRPYLTHLTFSGTKDRRKIIREATPPCPLPDAAYGIEQPPSESLEKDSNNADKNNAATEDKPECETPDEVEYL